MGFTGFLTTFLLWTGPSAKSSCVYSTTVRYTVWMIDCPSCQVYQGIQSKHSLYRCAIAQFAYGWRAGGFGYFFTYGFSCVNWVKYGG